MLPQDTLHVGSCACFCDSMDCLTADAQSTPPRGRCQGIPQGHRSPSTALQWLCGTKLDRPDACKRFHPVWSDAAVNLAASYRDLQPTHALPGMHAAWSHGHSPSS